MIFRPFYYFDRGCASYLFGCGTVGRCAVVDARIDDVETYARFAESKGMRITHVIDTHVHADHQSGGPEVARNTGAEYCLHEAAECEHPFTHFAMATTSTLAIRRSRCSTRRVIRRTASASWSPT